MVCVDYKMLVDYGICVGFGGDFICVVVLIVVCMLMNFYYVLVVGN